MNEAHVIATLLAAAAAATALLVVAWCAVSGFRRLARHLGRRPGADTLGARDGTARDLGAGDLNPRDPRRRAGA